jgi:hypothetical protein
MKGWASILMWLVSLASLGFSVDPPETILTSPADGYSNDSGFPVSINFTCNATDDVGLENISLYITSNGNFSINQTSYINGTANQSSWIVDLDYGDYTWNCLTYDSENLSSWGANRSISINATPVLELSVLSPDGVTVDGSSYGIDFTYRAYQANQLYANIYYSQTQGAQENLISGNIPLGYYLEDMEGMADWDGWEDDGSGMDVSSGTSTTQVREGNHAARIDVTSSTGGYAYSSKEYRTTYDWSGYEKIAVWVHGDSSNVTYSIRLKNETDFVSTYETAVDWNGWRRLEFDRGSSNWSAIKSIQQVVKDASGGERLYVDAMYLLSDEEIEQAYYWDASSVPDGDYYIDLEIGQNSTSGPIFTVGKNSAPEVNMTYNNSGSFRNNEAIMINWSAYDQDNDTLVFDLYYDFDNNPDNGKTLIAGNLNLSYCAGGPIASCSYNWSLAGLGPGNYYTHIITRDTSNTGMVLDSETMIAYHTAMYNLTYNGTTKTLMEHMLDNSDQITVMSYYDDAPSIIGASQAEIAYGEEIGNPVLVGVETKNLSSLINTFYDENETYMESVLDDVRTEYLSNSSFKGFAVHYYESYKSWEDNLTISESETRTMWLWSPDEIMEREEETQELTDFIQKKDIETIYAYVDYDPEEYRTWWQKFVNRMHDNGISVYLMFDNMEYATEHDRALEKFSSILAFDEDVDGLTLDLETNQHPDWDSSESANTSTNRIIATGLVDLIAELQKMKVTKTEITTTSTGYITIIGPEQSGDSGKGNLHVTSYMEGNSVYMEVSEAGATVRLVLEEPYEGVIKSGTTGSNGSLAFVLPKNGTYVAYISKPGYRSEEITFEFKEIIEAEPVTEPVEHPEVKEDTPGCTEDNDCLGTERCDTDSGECLAITGTCGYAENHEWVGYECCEDDDCNITERCLEHLCIEDKKPVNESPIIVEEIPPEEQPKTEESKGCLLSALILTAILLSAFLKR